MYVGEVLPFPAVDVHKYIQANRPRSTSQDHSVLCSELYFSIQKLYFECAALSPSDEHSMTVIEEDVQELEAMRSHALKVCGKLLPTLGAKSVLGNIQTNQNNNSIFHFLTLAFDAQQNDPTTTAHVTFLKRLLEHALTTTDMRDDVKLTIAKGVLLSYRCALDDTMQRSLHTYILDTIDFAKTTPKARVLLVSNFWEILMPETKAAIASWATQQTSTTPGIATTTTTSDKCLTVMLFADLFSRTPDNVAYLKYARNIASQVISGDVTGEAESIEVGYAMLALYRATLEQRYLFHAQRIGLWLLSRPPPSSSSAFYSVALYLMDCVLPLDSGYPWVEDGHLVDSLRVRSKLHKKCLRNFHDPSSWQRNVHSMVPYEAFEIKMLQDGYYQAALQHIWERIPIEQRLKQGALLRDTDEIVQLSLRVLCRHAVYFFKDAYPSYPLCPTRAYVVMFDMIEHPSINSHTDNCDITLSVCLENTDLVGGRLLLERARIRYRQVPGNAVMMGGNVPHRTKPVREGQRVQLVMLTDVLKPTHTMGGSFPIEKLNTDIRLHILTFCTFKEISHFMRLNKAIGYEARSPILWREVYRNNATLNSFVPYTMLEEHGRYVPCPHPVIDIRDNMKTAVVLSTPDSWMEATKLS
eukprot:PhF_6_TR31811/c1_g1_i8/m.46958